MVGVNSWKSVRGKGGIPVSDRSYNIVLQSDEEAANRGSLGMRVPLPASHPMLSRGKGEGRDGCESVTPYSHYDCYDAPAPAGKRGRRPWLAALAVLGALALLISYHEELRHALSAAEDELRDGGGAISLEGASQLKESLRDITTRLSRADRDQLGALVDEAEKTPHGQGRRSSSDVAGDVAQAIDDGASFGFSATEKGPKASSRCGSACMDALASKLPEKKSGPANDMGKYDVGDELKYRRDKAASNEELKGAFMKAQARKMDEAVKRGWADLKDGKTADAREQLKEAKDYHESERRLMRGTPNIAEYLATPKQIRKLEDGIDEAKGSIDRTPGRLAKIIDKPVPQAGHTSHTRDRGIPKKLEAIMEKQFKAADDNVRRHTLSRISQHFRGGRSGGDSSSAWTPGGAATVTLPRSSGHHSADSGLNGNFNRLTQNAIERGRTAVNDGKYQDARKALSKAKMFLTSLKDARARDERKARRRGTAVGGGAVREEATIDKLGLEVAILSHAVSNLGRQRRRAEHEQLQDNLRILHAPIQGESMADFTSGSRGGADGASGVRTDKRFEQGGTADPLRGSSSSTGGARIQGDDRALFSASIRHGDEDAQSGEIARAQAKLVEARYYAKRDGLLRDDAEMDDRQMRNMHVAKRALKLLARSIVNAEERLQDPVRFSREGSPKKHAFSLSSIMGLRSSGRSQRGGEGGVRGDERTGREQGGETSAASGREDEGEGRRWGGAMARALDPNWGVVDKEDVSDKDKGAIRSLDKTIDSALSGRAGDGAGGSGGNGGLMGALSRGGDWWRHKISHQGPDGGEELARGSRRGAGRRRGSLSAAKRWVGMYDKGSDILAAANGEQEADRLADKRAKKALSRGCNGLNCLFDEAASAQSKDGLGAGGASAGSGALSLAGGSKGLSAADFGKAKTATHTGMHYSYRLDHLSMTHGGSGIPRIHSKDGVNVPGQGDVGPDVSAAKIGKAGNSLASRRMSSERLQLVLGERERE